MGEEKCLPGLTWLIYWQTEEQRILERQREVNADGRGRAEAKWRPGRFLPFGVQRQMSTRCLVCVKPSFLSSCLLLPHGNGVRH